MDGRHSDYLTLVKGMQVPEKASACRGYTSKA